MHRYLTRACVAAAAGVALSTAGMGGAGASGTALRAPQMVRASPAVMARAAASPGAQLWAKLYNGGQAFSVAVSPDGSTVYVTGNAGNNGRAAYTTVAYNAATGARRWASHYNGGVTAFKVAVSPDGKTVFVTGSVAASATGFDYATVAYNAATGARRWAKLYSGGQAVWLAVSPDGKTVFVTGAVGTDTGSEDYATVAYNAATGARRWAKRYSGTGNGNYAESVAVSPTGNEVFVTGASTAASGRTNDYATVAYSAATGAQLWARRYNGPINSGSTAISVAVSPTGKTVFVTGNTRNAASGSDYATIAYDAATGAQRWVKLYNGGGFGGNNPAKLITVSPTGKTVFVTGNVASTTYDYATVAYDAATGAQLWAKRYDGSGHSDDNAESVAVSPTGGTVYVTGYSYGANLQPDYATVAYNAATGAQLWAKRYNGPNNAGALAFSVTVSRTGTVFVTGEAHPSSTSQWEYATIAYHG